MSECTCKGDSGNNFSIISWHVDDLEEVFQKNGIPFTEENVQKFLDSRGPRTLVDRSIEEGWTILGDIVSDMEDEFNLGYDTIWRWTEKGNLIRQSGPRKFEVIVVIEISEGSRNIGYTNLDLADFEEDELRDFADEIKLGNPEDLPDTFLVEYLALHQPEERLTDINKELLKHLQSFYEVPESMSNALMMKREAFPQVCNHCGREFKILYIEDGHLDYLGDVCNCEADFSPVGTAPSISQWLDQKVIE